LQVLEANSLVLNGKKCSFGQQRVDYLGHVISRGVEPDPDKVVAVKEWLIPKSVKDLRGFLGLSRYYRRFILNYGKTAMPLTTLLQKQVESNWSSVADQAFNQLKTALVAAPVLALPDFGKPFTIETDTSGNGTGAILQQQGHLIAFTSKAMGKKNHLLSAYEKEFYVILFAVRKWQHYLLSQHFIIKTDRKA
jgi:hypothetical protein